MIAFLPRSPVMRLSLASLVRDMGGVQHVVHRHALDRGLLDPSLISCGALTPIASRIVGTTLQHGMQLVADLAPGCDAPRLVDHGGGRHAPPRRTSARSGKRHPRSVACSGSTPRSRWLMTATSVTSCREAS